MIGDKCEAVRSITSKLVEGDALKPSCADVIVQQGVADVGTRLSHGWRALTGTAQTSLVARVIMRAELELEGLQS